MRAIFCATLFAALIALGVSGCAQPPAPGAPASASSAASSPASAAAPAKQAAIAPAVAGDGSLPTEVESALAAVRSELAAKKFGAAKIELEKTASMVTKLREAQLAQSIPPAPEGFTVEPQEAPTFGGLPMAKMGSTVTARYKQGEKSFTLAMATDSPQLEMLVSRIMNPATNTASQATSLSIKGNQAIVNSNGQTVKLQVAVAGGKMLLTVTSTDFSQDVLQKFVDGIDYDALMRAIQ